MKCWTRQSRRSGLGLAEAQASGRERPPPTSRGQSNENEAKTMSLTLPHASSCSSIVQRTWSDAALSHATIPGRACSS